MTVSPSPVLIELEDSAQALNFDLILRNDLDEALDLDEIEVSVFDTAGKLVTRRFIDGNGTRPSIRTADLAEVAAHSTQMVFNPFHRFDRGIDLHAMKFAVHLSSKDGKPRYEATAEVRPSVYRNRSRFGLPLAGRLLVYDGHDFLAHHRRWDYTIPGLQALGFRTNFMRYSYDFVFVDESGRMSSGTNDDDNATWFGFGKPIRATAAGVVVSVRDDQPDDRRFDPGTIAKDGPMKIWGNSVVIDHGQGEFSLYGHIRQGSARVKAGDKVARGQQIAAIGASGSSMFPHLHYELQTGPDTNAEGLPSTFESFVRIRGSQRLNVKSGTVNSGDLLESR